MSLDRKDRSTVSKYWLEAETTVLRVKNIERMKARAGLCSSYRREQIINENLETMLNEY